MATYQNEIIVYLANGNTIRSEGDDYLAGAYVRICDPDGNELFYWDKEEWAESPEEVMGAILVSAQTCVKEEKQWCIHCKAYVLTTPPDALEPPDHIRCKECQRVIT